jgi:hypothetical protein
VRKALASGRSSLSDTEWIVAAGLILLGSGCATAPLLAVANANNNSVTEYALPANGNVAPTGALSGGQTGLALPAEVGNSGLTLLVGNNQGAQSITAYFPAATGDARPILTIAGPDTGLNGFLTAVAFDGPGNIYALTAGNPSQILIYPTGSTGDQRPKAIISGSNTGLDHPIALAVNNAGQMYVANFGSSSIPNIAVYAPGSSGNVAPTSINYVGPYEPIGIAVDASGAIYLSALSPPSVIVFDSANDSYPLRIISGPSTGLNNHTGAITVDSSGNIYVSGMSSGQYAISVFGPKANGNVKPDAIISGAQTKLDSPQGLTVLQ